MTSLIDSKWIHSIHKGNTFLVEAGKLRAENVEYGEQTMEHVVHCEAKSNAAKNAKDKLRTVENCSVDDKQKFLVCAHIRIFGSEIQRREKFFEQRNHFTNIYFYAIQLFGSPIETMKQA